jgi:hypothetical protein
MYRRPHTLSGVCGGVRIIVFVYKRPTVQKPKPFGLILVLEMSSVRIEQLSGDESLDIKNLF